MIGVILVVFIIAGFSILAIALILEWWNERK